MAQVSNLRIDVQSGASRLYASWSFTAPSGSSGSSGGTGGTGGVIKQEVSYQLNLVRHIITALVCLAGYRVEDGM